MAAAAAEYQYEETLAEAAEAAAAKAAAEHAAGQAAEERGSTSTGISIKVAAVPTDHVRADEDFDIPLMNDETLETEVDYRAAEGGYRASPGPRDIAESPAGLYSPASGLGWESYLKDRLDAELSRSASFEQDLSLLAIAYDGLTSQDANYAAIGESIEKFFSFRDLAFERGDDGFSVILPNIDSSHALRMAQEFYKKLVFLAEGDFAELELSPLFMGISSRGGRLVDAGRLIDEADAAIEKARYEKDSRIVAFKPDPDKYRLFLASKGA
jgi:GGDEF domain-containing protein